jgi:hypothetical protein
MKKKQERVGAAKPRLRAQRVTDEDKNNRYPWWNDAQLDHVINNYGVIDSITRQDLMIAKEIRFLRARVREFEAERDTWKRGWKAINKDGNTLAIKHNALREAGEALVLVVDKTGVVDWELAGEAAIAWIQFRKLLNEGGGDRAAKSAESRQEPSGDYEQSESALDCHNCKGDGEIMTADMRQDTCSVCEGTGKEPKE